MFLSKLRSFTNIAVKKWSNKAARTPPSNMTMQLTGAITAVTPRNAAAELVSAANAKGKKDKKTSHDQKGFFGPSPTFPWLSCQRCLSDTPSGQASAPITAVVPDKLSTKDKLTKRAAALEMKVIIAMNILKERLAKEKTEKKITNELVETIMMSIAEAWLKKRTTKAATNKTAE